MVDRFCPRLLHVHRPPLAHVYRKQPAEGGRYLGGCGVTCIANGPSPRSSAPSSSERIYTPFLPPPPFTPSARETSLRGRLNSFHRDFHSPREAVIVEKDRGILSQLGRNFKFSYRPHFDLCFVAAAIWSSYRYKRKVFILSRFWNLNHKDRYIKYCVTLFIFTSSRSRCFIRNIPVRDKIVYVKKSARSELEHKTINFPLYFFIESTHTHTSNVERIDSLFANHFFSLAGYYMRNEAPGTVTYTRPLVNE